MLQRLSIRYKIGFIAAIGFVGFVIYQAASYRLSVNIRDQLQNILTEDFALLKFSNDIQVNFSNLNKLYQASLAEADMDTLIEAESKATRIRIQFETLRDRFRLDDPYFNELHSAYINYITRTSAHTAAVLDDSLDYERILAGYKEISLLRELYLKVQTQFVKDRYKSFEEKLIVIEKEEEYLVQFGLILGLILSCILGVFSLLIIRNLVLAFSNAVNVAEQIASGNLNQRIESFAQDETGQLMRSLHAMRDALKAQSKENQQREGIQDFLAGLNETMRGDQNVHELTQAVLEYLASHFQAQLGAFFLLDEGSLQISASYAYPDEHAASRSFKLGESLIGQVAQGKQPQILLDIPDDYVQIGSAVGESSPRSLMLVPILFEGGLIGILELGAFQCFGADELKLMQLCNEAIAIAVNSAQSRVKMASILKLEQKQAHELDTQRQALAKSNKTLAERSDELDKQNARLEHSRAALLEKSEALEISGRYKTQFLSTMSHELRTPLNSILILSEALMDNRDKRLADQEVEHARVIHTAGEDLLLLINDILDLSKVEEGKMEIVYDEIQLKVFADSIHQLFDYIAKDKGLEFKINVGPEVVDTFYCDQHRLTQIVKNFISNALKFTDKGGVYVDIDLPKAPFLPKASKAPVNKTLLITVRDTGMGIPESKQGLVFEAFKQADGTTSRKHGGTGLGLTISNELAKLLGGEIILYSEGEGEGATFALLLPIGDSSMLSIGRSFSSAVELASTNPDFATEVVEEQTRLSDVLFISSSVDLQKSIAELTANAADVKALSFNSRESLADIKYLSEDIRTKLFLVDADGFDLDQWEELRLYLQQKQRRYGILAVIADQAHRLYIEEIGGLYLDRKILLDDREVAFDALLSIYKLTDRDIKRVLVIEDNPVFIEVIRTVFANNDVPIIITNTGAQALNLLHSPAFGCLVVDLNLPDFSGVELLSKIRALPGYTTTETIVFTAEDLDPSRLTSIYQYANQVVLKSPKSISDICLHSKSILQQETILPDTLFMQQSNTTNTHYSSGMLQDVNILLVDDDERNLYSITQALEAEGVNVVSVKSGERALDVLASNTRLQLVLLDIMMPDMDGYQVLRRLRASSELPQLPVIALTAKAMVGDRELCLAAGATDYLSKPVDISELLDCMSSHLFQSLEH